MKKILVLLIFIVACEKTPVSEAPTNNVDIPVALMFTHDGCNVYRFYDDGRNHYYTDCNGTQNTYIEPCGKNCVNTINDDIPTAKVKR
jgi:hypothetical protein